MRLNEKYRLPDESDDEFAVRMFPLETAKQSRLAGLPFHDVHERDVPVDRTNRKAWRVQSVNGVSMVREDVKI